METKLCTLCQTLNPLTEFNVKKSSPDGLQNVCRKCSRERSKKYYKDNKAKHRANVKENNKQYRARNRKYIYEYLQINPCVDCHETDFRVLEFDHRPGESKLGGIGKLAALPCSMEVLMAEIAKCDVRCKNCHTIETYNRLGSTWHDLFLDK